MPLDYPSTAVALTRLHLSRSAVQFQLRHVDDRQYMLAPYVLIVPSATTFGRSNLAADSDVPSHSTLQASFESVSLTASRTRGVISPSGSSVSIPGLFCYCRDGNSVTKLVHGSLLFEDHLLPKRAQPCKPRMKVNGLKLEVTTASWDVRSNNCLIVICRWGRQICKDR